MTNPKTTRHHNFILQSDYLGGQLGSHRWSWVDTGVKFSGGTVEEVKPLVETYIGRQAPSKFVRGYRLVKRQTVTTDTVLEDLSHLMQEKPSDG